MHIIILANGGSERFRREGYTTPKPFINIGWRGTVQTMIEHVIATVPWSFSYVTVGLPKGWYNHISDPKTRRLYPVELEKTNGPAHTALKVLQVIGADASLILDVDILNYTNDLFRLTELRSPGVLVSKSLNPAFSYVNRLGAFDSIKEKKRISEYAVRGAYFIPKNAIDEFMSIAGQMTTGEEPFISHVLGQMKGPKTSVLTTYTPVDWGTPRDIKISGAHIVYKEENNARDTRAQCP